MPQEHHHTIMSDGFKDESDALIDVTQKAKTLHSRNKKIVHIIYANLILFEGEWKSIASVSTICSFNPNKEPAIIYGHLPFKYGANYDQLSPEVDHLSIIKKKTSWKDIKRILLDLHFFQAVHCGLLKRMNGSKGGGYLKSSKNVRKFDNAFIPVLDAHYQDAFLNAVTHEHMNFEAFIHRAETQIITSEQDNFNRNLREGRRYKNLIVKLDLD